MNDVFFRTLGVPKPDDRFGIGRGTQGEQTAEALRDVERTIATGQPDVVIALGYTNAVLSAAIAISKMQPEFAHIETGIRSFDRSMPEEINRILGEDVTDLAFAPTGSAVEYLAEDGINTSVWMVGNTIVDTCLEHAPIAGTESTILDKLELNSNTYAFTTIHRPRNTDDRTRLRKIVEALDSQ